MPNSNEIPAADAIQLILQPVTSLKCLDVRSEGEFAQGAIPGSCNIPILSNPERHQVGLAYKETGPDSAVELGHLLVTGHREALIAKWQSELIGLEFPLVNCWRGGMRSQIAVDWIQAAGTKAIKVIGGYKAMRKELLAPLENLPPLVVIAGPTGSNKTKLLRKSRCHLDLELLANHRGSAFGQNLSSPQPSQTNFENSLGLALLKLNTRKLFVEDESMMIGQIHLPPALRTKMNDSPVVVIRMTVEERVENILEEYITVPQKEGMPAQALHSYYQQSIHRIAKKLGGLLAQQILGKMQLAFASSNPVVHREWIQDLLLNYYDNAYAFSFARAGRKIAFEGDWNECNQWIQNQFV